MESDVKLMPSAEIMMAALKSIGADNFDRSDMDLCDQMRDTIKAMEDENRELLNEWVKVCQALGKTDRDLQWLAVLVLGWRMREIAEAVEKGELTL